jgi:hypothetical protein
MLTEHVNGAFGPLEVILHSPTSGQVRTADQPLLVNGVEVTVTAYIAEDKNPHSPTHGGVKIEYLSIKKPSDTSYKWEPSFKMREKIAVQALAIWQSVLADPAMLAQVKVDKSAVETARAQSKVLAQQSVRA